MADTYVLDAENIPVIEKAAADVFDYTFDWTDHLTDIGDSVLSYTVTVDSNGVKDTDSRTGNLITVWVSGGSPNRIILITCIITTASVPARVITKWIRIKIKP